MSGLANISYVGVEGGIGIRGEKKNKGKNISTMRFVLLGE